MTARYETIEAGRADRATARRIACALVLSFGFVGLLFLPRNAVAAGEQACLNESLRSALGSGFLPDCRAYEKVSPDYKEGYTLLVESLASDGNSAVVHSFATLAGSLGSSEKIETGSVYLDKRTASGWTLTPMNALLSEFIGQDMLAAEANRGLSLWMQHTPDQGPFNRGLYVRAPTGHFSFIGPASPSDSSEEEAGDVIDLNRGDIDQVTAATADYGHVLLQAESPTARWPFDETDMEGPGRTSVYEYSGAGNGEPTLVGVVGPRGSRNLVALCGNTMGAGGSGSSFNALSSDGETVFFTVNPCSPGPATAELYARLHGAVDGVGATETVDVSASECTTSCGSESGKNFEGASEDGRRVFFTSTQKLTDDAVDGAASGTAAKGPGCARTEPAPPDCNLYEYDFARPPGKSLRAVSVGAEVLGVTGIAEDGSRVYYVSRAAIGLAGANVYNALPTEGKPNMYVHDAVSGRTAFVATLGPGDEEDWLRSFTRTAQVAGASGRFLLFESSKPGLTTTADDTSSITQLIEYKAPGEGEGSGQGEAAELVRVTKGEDGFNQDGNGVSAGVLGPKFASRNSILGSGLDFKTTTTHLNISGDGQEVLFLTAGQLSPRATSATQSGCESLYEFHASDALAHGSVHLLSGGGDTHLYKGICSVLFQGIDAAGANVLLGTGDPLLSGDADGGQFDTYDARVGGGFAPALETGTCDTGFCEATPSVSIAPPTLLVTGSALGSGEAPTLAPHAGGSKGKRLTLALRACRAKPRDRRARCERAARRRFGAKARPSGLRRGK
jgi:hypothetical protein